MSDIEKAVLQQLEYIGEDPRREGLAGTPARVVRSWSELYSGYAIDPASVFKTFSDGACQEMVVLRDVDFFSTCEHHLLPFFGTVAIGYIPDKSVIGVSKLARLVDIFSRRLQIQERLTAEIADTIVAHLAPKGAMVVCRATHLCMVARGVRKNRPEMVTSAIRGSFAEAEVRAEFLRLME
jgi:GTP cyclohydrolase I